MRHRLSHKFLYEEDSGNVIRGWSHNDDYTVVINWKLNYDRAVPDVDWYNVRGQHIKDIPESFVVELYDYYQKEKARILLGKYRS